MTLDVFMKKYKNCLFRVLASVAIGALAAAFIFAFREGMLPYAEDGDAFDTVYAIEEK